MKIQLVTDDGEVIDSTEVLSVKQANTIWFNITNPPHGNPDR